MFAFFDWSVDHRDLHVLTHSFPTRRSSDLMDQFDIIVIGGGSAGSAAAARLAEDGTRRVCLVEAGGSNDIVRVKTPGLMPFIPKASNYRYETVPQPGLNGRIGYQPRGRGLGGSSAINAMVYIRGHAFDYDQWAALGADGRSEEHPSELKSLMRISYAGFS